MDAKRVLVCQSNACRKAGSNKVLTAFQARSPTSICIEKSGCLGQCGNGPMVLVLPEKVWYYRVHPKEVPAVIDRHFIGGNPIQSMLYPKFHQEDATMKGQ